MPRSIRRSARITRTIECGSARTIVLDLHQRAAEASLTACKEARETIRTTKLVRLSGGFSSIRDMA
ncbi:hypothetical protein BC2230_90103 [Burkholderia cepacia]